MAGFIAMHRCEEVLALIKRHRSAFILLTGIAMRARWKTDVDAVNGLAYRQCFVGDHDEMGLTRQEYRTALKKLEKCGFVTIEPTNRGTIVTLCENPVFSITVGEANQPANHQLTIKQPSDNHQLTTKEQGNTETREQGNTSASHGEAVVAFEMFREFAAKHGLAVPRKLSDARRKKLAARIDDAGGLDGFRQALDRIPLAPGLLGKNGRGWKASITWLLQQESFLKLLEGGYDGWGSDRAPDGLDRGVI